MAAEVSESNLGRPPANSFLVSGQGIPRANDIRRIQHNDAYVCDETVNNPEETEEYALRQRFSDAIVARM